MQPCSKYTYVDPRRSKVLQEIFVQMNKSEASIHCLSNNAPCVSLRSGKYANFLSRTELESTVFCACVNSVSFVSSITVGRSLFPAYAKTCRVSFPSAGANCATARKHWQEHVL